MPPCRLWTYKCLTAVAIVIRLASCHTPGMPTKPDRNERRLTFTVPPDDFHDLHQVAFTINVSVALLGRLAINRLLLDFTEGKLPLNNPEQAREPGHA